MASQVDSERSHRPYPLDVLAWLLAVVLIAAGLSLVPPRHDESGRKPDAPFSLVKNFFKKTVGARVVEAETRKAPAPPAVAAPMPSPRTNSH